MGRKSDDFELSDRQREKARDLKRQNDRLLKENDITIKGPTTKPGKGVVLKRKGKGDGFDAKAWR